ncbi:MAG: monofunctional biosynthetic peptidoglycan transglycosylase [Balneola sp.]|nr:monofunctional biosynthetic peptidoglycan transglycosylase [Balneola sp.]MBO6651778.1 monofunctional biosynthetic peptidoglycan transglycosylase [Balneola sp.]MBO6711971.1 monofunctional biosynthetic peptidoglycan transglycosylase [Balneola sp.]MBO6800167.1 monofunctional biosynthetic peptidoglycan transglycosylase [Balneola sp.]MBO6871671.1 monofunctional biosynthetic peptidoglycan transglycosylase [Balneola sp.]
MKWASISLVGFAVISFLMLVSLKWVNPSFTAFTLQEDWEEIGVERYSLKERWVSYEDIPQNIKWAVVASEDQKFWEHPGIDLVAIAEAYQEMEEGERVRGASTITQQVAKNLFLSSDKNFVRKGVEAGLALTIDALWGKERVLEVYLNIAEFGPGVYGIGKASDHFFDKDAEFLKDDESARMAAVLPNPKRMRVEPASSYVKERKDWILKNMMNLSGIAYYNYPEPEVVQDSVQTDSSFTFDAPFINRIQISRVGLSLSDMSSKNKEKTDSSATDSTKNRKFRF